MRIKSIAILLSFLLLPVGVYAQPPEAEEAASTPLFYGDPAPFDGILVREEFIAACIEDNAARERLTAEVEIKTWALEEIGPLYEGFVEDQRDRIEELSEVSLWDEIGDFVMLGLGLLLGVGGSALILGAVN